MEQNEILEETRRTNELLRGQLLWTRVAAALLAVLLTAVVVCLGNTMNSMGRISAALEGVDLAAVAEQVSKLDMDAVNRAISTLDGKIEAVHALGKAGIVFHVAGGRHLAAGRKLFQHHG